VHNQFFLESESIFDKYLPCNAFLNLLLGPEPWAAANKYYRERSQERIAISVLYCTYSYFVQQRLPKLSPSSSTAVTPPNLLFRNKKKVWSASLSLSLSLSHLICEQSRLLDKINALGHKWYTTVTAL